MLNLKNRTMKKLILFAIIPVLLSSCKKDLIEKANLNSNQKETTEFKKLNVKDNFNWSTSKMIDLKVSGLSTITKINKTLKVSSEDGKVVYFSINHQMDQNLTTKFILPKNVKNVSISYGELKKVVSSTNSEINFDFLPIVIEE